jgi:hypothetical protein
MATALQYKEDTTANGLFAECLGHSAKPLLHSAKTLLSAALGNEHSAKNPSAKVSFAECHISGTRQSLYWVSRKHSVKKIRRQLWRPLCRVPRQRHLSKNYFFENSLPSAGALHLAKNFFKIFAECHGSSTRQSWKIGSLLPSFAEFHGRQSPLFGVWHSATRGKMLFFCFFVFHQHKQRNHIYINIQHRIYHIHIRISSHTHP